MHEENVTFIQLKYWLPVLWDGSFLHHVTYDVKTTPSRLGRKRENDVKWDIILCLSEHHKKWERVTDRQTVRQQGKKEKRGQEIYIFHFGFVVHFLESYDKQLHKDIT